MVVGNCTRLQYRGVDLDVVVTIVSVIGEEGLGVPDTHAPFLTRASRLFIGILRPYTVEQNGR